MTPNVTRAEVCLLGLGVTDPREIDVRAIAHEVGAAVRIRKLTRCEARIVGTGDRAIISVSEDSGFQRRRFSIAHELGHWELHRGRQFECRAFDIDNAENGPLNPERQADEYAADLLMPWYLFKPRLAQAKHVDLALLEEMHRTFDASLPATALRIADANVEPVIVACYDQSGRRWFKRSKDVPERWFPVDKLDPDTYAADVLTGKRDRTHMSAVGANAWFDAEGIGEYEMREQSLRLSDGKVLVILRITEEAMQVDYGRFGHSTDRSR
ncbi:MAG: ImmA/IrrE family metallo-endopeptidase [Rhizobiales bacterium]|nr:ImmA/IrrE family metallo-endopeptidase [Hyphomicrobiales bacterium]